MSTGDYHTLSAVDLQLIAISYTILENNKKLHLIRNEPLEPINYIPSNNKKNDS